MIEGERPYFVTTDGTKLTHLNQLLSLTMPKQDGKEGVEQISATSGVLTAPIGMAFDDVEALVVADNTVYPIASKVQVINNNDKAGETESIGTVTAVWKDKNNVVITDLNQVLKASKSPYSLTIRLDNLKAQAKYGLPASQDYGGLTKTYAFTSNNNYGGVAYVKPGSMRVYTGKAAEYIKFTQGYNDAVWDRGKGFSVSKMRATRKQFPTTGFNNAIFYLIGEDADQRKYRCRLATKNKANAWVKLSGNTNNAALGEGCRITYNSVSRPTIPVTIDMEYKKTDGTWARIDRYTIATPKKWGVWKGQSDYANGWLPNATVFPALNACRLVGKNANQGTIAKWQAIELSEQAKTWRQQYLYRRDELTNGPFANREKYPEGRVFKREDCSIEFDYFSRDVDGTFMGEWGSLRDYMGSGTLHDYWTSEVAWDGRHYYVYSPRGNICASPPNPSHRNVVAFCRDDE